MLSDLELQKAFAQPIQANREAMQSLEHRLDAIHDAGLTRDQFDLFRVNYYFRSVTTLWSVAATAAAALANEPARISMAKLTVYGALLEELGAPEGESRAMTPKAVLGKAHPHLLLDCLNGFGAGAFGLPDLTPTSIGAHGRLQDFSKDYRIAQQALFTHKDLICVLSAAYAQETAADGMLKTLRDHLFMPLKPKLLGSRFNGSMQYFRAHLGPENAADVKDEPDVEELHAQEALVNLIDELRERPDTLGAAVQAASASAALQNKFFGELVTAMEAHR